MYTTVLAVIGAVSGIIGTALGVFNAWRQYDKDAVKLGLTWTVEPWGGSLGQAIMVHSLVVENRSNFAITIADVGLNFDKRGAPKITFSQTINKDDETSTVQLPLRIESRDSITLASDGDATDSVFREFGLKHLYVRTACGVMKKLSNPT
jgi:hypothetical protein